MYIDNMNSTESNSTPVNGTYLLRKFPGKGGWTYALIPEIKPDKKTYFNWVTVSGSIDSYILTKIKLMPYGNGEMFLPVKAAIRKAIKKEAGDTVQIKLHPDTTPISIPDEIKMCFSCEDPSLLSRFMNLRESEQKSYLDRIDKAKTEDTRVARIAEMMKQLSDRLPNRKFLT